MAALEELMYQALAQDMTMSGLLAQFSGAPAIFEYRAPSDTDAGWNGQKQYPRLDYTVSRDEDPERRVSGLVMFNVWNDTNSDTTIESIEAQLRTLLDGAMFHPTDEPVIGLRWARSEFFTAGREQSGISTSELQPSDLLYGMTVEFYLIAFPLQTTYSPDPVVSLTNWAASSFTSGLQVDPTAWNPTASEPALYWRFENFQMAKMDQAVTWYDATLYGHVLAPMPQDRLTWVRRVAEKLLNDRVVTMDNGSWMVIQKLSADTKQDPLRVGQIRMTVRYGVSVPQPTTEALNNAYFNGATKGSVSSGG